MFMNVITGYLSTFTDVQGHILGQVHVKVKQMCIVM